MNIEITIEELKAELRKGALVKIEMLPIELHWMKDWSVNGLPRTADGEASGVILAALKRTSAEFGTQFTLRTDGIIEVALPTAR